MSPHIEAGAHHRRSGRERNDPDAAPGRGVAVQAKTVIDLNRSCEELKNEQMRHTPFAGHRRVLSRRWI